jgi:hypothetical protein
MQPWTTVKSKLQIESDGVVTHNPHNHRLPHELGMPTVHIPTVAISALACASMEATCAESRKRSRPEMTQLLRSGRTPLPLANAVETKYCRLG